MNQSVVRHAGPAEFLERAEEWLLTREDLHNLMLGIAYGHRVAPRPHGDALYATVEVGDRIVGCMMRTPPHKLLLTDMPIRACVAVAESVAEVYHEIPAVLGPVPLVEAVAELWVSLKGGAWRAGSRQRLHRLDAVTRPVGVPGSLRAADRGDLDLALDWAALFAAEIGYDAAPEAETVGGWIASRTLFLWEDDGPVSMGVAHGRTPNGIRVGYVYTPRDRRGRGYAGACVAEISQRMLDRGLSFCVLYTDLANPTSNALYQRLGYYPLADFRDYEIIPSQEPQ